MIKHLEASTLFNILVFSKPASGLLLPLGFKGPALPKRLSGIQPLALRMRNVRELIMNERAEAARIENTLTDEEKIEIAIAFSKTAGESGFKTART